MTPSSSPSDLFGNRTLLGIVILALLALAIVGPFTGHVEVGPIAVLMAAALEVYAIILQRGAGESASAENSQTVVLDRISKVCSEITAGNFEARIVGVTEEGELAQVQHAVNDMIDRCDAFVREATASLEAVCRSLYYRRILTGGLNGSFRAAADIINNAIVTQERAVVEAREKAAAEQAKMIGALGQGLTKLAEGNLTFRLAEFPADYVRLQEDFNAAAEQLAGTMAVIIRSAQAISAATKEIAVGTDDLAGRTEDQAARIREIVVAFGEIATTVSTTAEGARHASDVVLTTKTDAERSAEVVRQAVDAMGRIEKSSKNIVQIISVIDEIAFQTNLLALNAGVEAARAGEAGRGFGVVAAEVRALAQRCVEAAKEIKSLIGVASTEVANGVTLVKETGQALGRIAVSVGEVNHAVAAIASGAAEQSKALQEIDGAMSQMDEDTLKNAAMVEETTAATHSLKGETEELVRSVQNFVIERERPNGASSRSRFAA